MQVAEFDILGVVQRIMQKYPFRSTCLWSKQSCYSVYKANALYLSHITSLELQSLNVSRKVSADRLQKVKYVNAKYRALLFDRLLLDYIYG